MRNLLYVIFGLSLILPLSLAGASDESTAIALAVRADRIAELLGAYYPQGLYSAERSSAPPAVPFIARDWQRAYPAAASGLERAIQAKEWLAIRATITEHPWSTFRWGEVMAARIARAEVRVARRLGIDLVLVQQLFDHTFRLHQERPRVTAIVDAWARQSATPPLFGDAALKVLLEELGSESPEFSRDLALVTHPRAVLPESFGPAIEQSGGVFRLQYAQPLHFRFDDNDDLPDADVHVALLRRVVSHLDKFAANVTERPESIHRRYTLDAIRALREQARHELRTLPPRRAATAARDWRWAWDDPSWAQFDDDETWSARCAKWLGG